MDETNARETSTSPICFVIRCPAATTQSTACVMLMGARRIPCSHAGLEMVEPRYQQRVRFMREASANLYARPEHELSVREWICFESWRDKSLLYSRLVPN